MTENDKQHAAYQRQLLNLMGITPWVLRSTAPKVSVDWRCRMQAAAIVPNTPTLSSSSANINVRIDAQKTQILKQTEVVSATSPASLLADAVDAAATIIPIVQLSASKEPVQTVSSDEKHDRLLASSIHYLEDIAVSVLRFELYAIRYRHWLLLADRGQMNVAALGVWQRLTEALRAEQDKRQYSGESVPLMVRTLRYPLVSDAQLDANSGGDQRWMSLLGFLGRLCQMDNALPTHVGLLTPLEGIALGRVLGARCQVLPSLHEMVDDKQKKIYLWQQLQAP